MGRIQEALKIRPGEGRTSALLIGLMLFSAVGGALGGNATEALFFARFGVELLPAMYVILGLFTFVTSMVITVVMGRIPKQRLFAYLPFLIAFTLVVEWLVVPLNLKWFFAFMWLVMNVIGSLQGLYTWGLAGAACDPRQAKRLFPLFSAGGILGTVVGGLVTPPLATWLHAENLLLVWAGTLLVAFILGRGLVGPIPPETAANRSRRPGVVAEMQRGYRFVRRSVVMQWISYSAVLFSVCYFSLALPFSRGATLQFPDADRLAGFLGLFQSVNTAVALLISLFLTNRLFARFGIMPMLLLFPLIYLAGFGVLAVTAPFALLVAARFAQMVWMQGVASPAWQAVFNIVPPDQRDQVRAFVGGVPEQAGTFIAGLVLMIGEQALQPRQLYWIGLAAAVLLVYLLWRAGRAYAGALFDALRAGQPQVFYTEEQPFGGFRTDAAAVASVYRALDDPDPGTRRVAVEILGNLPVPDAAGRLVHALPDADCSVRIAALHGLARLRPAAALAGVAACLDDPDPEVRWQAVETLAQFAPFPDDLCARVERLFADPDPRVRIRAALALQGSGAAQAAMSLLHDLASGGEAAVRVEALRALGECADPSGPDLAISALDEENIALRKAAFAALARMHPPGTLERLIAHLAEDEPTVRRALAEAIGILGPAAFDSLARALADPATEDTALMALERLPLPQTTAPQIHARAQAAVQAALRYHSLALGLEQAFDLPAGVDGRERLLIDSLRDQAEHCAVNALRYAGLLNGRERVAAVVENLRSRDPLQRAYALEMLDSLDDRALLHPILALWEAGERQAARPPEDWLPGLLHDPQPWLRACAALLALKSDRADVRAALRTLAASDPDFLVRDVAKQALSGDDLMETLPTLSMMERILFLRRVPMFADLSPADIKQVAAGMGEAVFSHGDLLAEQGQIGEEMYIIVSGEVRVLLTSEAQKTAGEVARRRPGDFVGEMAVISREPRFATLVADGTVRTLYLSQRQFESILRERPEIGLAVMRVLCQRLKQASAASPV